MPRRRVIIDKARREFLCSAASGLGGIALGAALTRDGLIGPHTVIADETEAETVGRETGADSAPLHPRPPHFEPRAKACIFIFMAGAPSQMDLFDPKPVLNQRHGQKLPQEILDKARFAFIQPENATLMGTGRKFSRHGQCGMDFSDLVPHLGGVADDLLMIRSLHSEEFNHHPGQLMMQCGVSRFGMPTMGSWLTYGLGSESQDLPGYVVLTAGRGSSGGATLWQSGFLPSHYAGVLFRNGNEPVLNLGNPAGLPNVLQRRSMDALNDLNRRRYQEVHDPEIASRIAAYELAYRMQRAAPELVDVSGETKETLELYGIGRPEPKPVGRGAASGQKTYETFARNCLLARRLVERGVRFVNIIHASWDQHSNLDAELSYNATMADRPIAGLIRDLKRRGLLDRTMVVWGSEFGRTPLGENRPGREANTGRDHHPFAFTMLMAGGGLKSGMVYGETDEIGWGVVRDPVHINDLHATMLDRFGLDHLRLTHRFQGRDFRLTDVGGKVIRDWLA